MSGPDDSSAWAAPPPGAGAPAPSGWSLPPATPAPEHRPTFSTPTPPARRSRRGLVLALVLLVALVAGAGAWYLTRDEPGEPLTTAEWADRYCGIVTPYSSQASSLLQHVTVSLTLGGDGKVAKAKMVEFGHLLDDVLGRLATLADEHPISDPGGDQLRLDLQGAIGSTRTTLSGAMDQITAIDPAGGNFAPQAMAVLSATGIDAQARIETRPSPALNALNLAIESNSSCATFFAAGAGG